MLPYGEVAIFLDHYPWFINILSSHYNFYSKHVVFGKVLNGKALLKKLEALGSESGKPTCPVKIVDCGEASNIDTQNQLHGEKGK